ncbi:MAG: hypothetical protein J6C38_05060 [Oscillospiraceae bacterium]|nr:hypothetical protein [Oscillospiraceae bacterium]
MKLQKINYTDTLIYKALEKLDMLELLERDNKSYVFNSERNVPVRAAKTITLHRLNLQIPEGTLFFISRFGFERTLSYPKNFELEFAFPDEEETKKSGKMVRRYVPCNVDSNTYEILVCGEMPLSELIEKVDGETVETMKELYMAERDYSKHEFIYDNKYYDSSNILKCIIAIALSISIPCLVFSCALAWQWFIPFGICVAIAIGFGIALAIKYFKHDYEETSDAKTLREKMSKLCKIIEEKETA